MSPLLTCVPGYSSQQRLSHVTEAAHRRFAQVPAGRSHTQTIAAELVGFENVKQLQQRWSVKTRVTSLDS